MGDKIWRKLCVVVVVALMVSACGGGSSGTATADGASATQSDSAVSDETASDGAGSDGPGSDSAASDSAASDSAASDSAASADDADPVATVAPTPVPPTPTPPPPTPTPDPDRDGDGVVNEDDDFPDDATRSIALVSQFPLVDGVNQLPEDEPSVQLLRVVQDLVLADETDAAVIDEHFDQGFVDSVGRDTVDTVLGNVRTEAGGTWEVVDVRAVTQWWLWVQMGNPSRPEEPTHLVRLGLDPNTDKINELAINGWRRGLQTQQYAEDRSKDLDAVFAELAEQTQYVGLLLAEVNDDGCVAVRGHNEDIPLGTGSMFKQWVLGAAAAEIEAGRLSVDDPVAFTPGEFMAGGALTTSQFTDTVTLTLQQAANLMMNRSDNGATDMVERTVGRQPAWDFVASAGLADPTVLNPIIGVRDYDHLFSSVSPAQLAQYQDGTEEEQEAFLLEVLEPLGPTRLGIYGNPGAQFYSWQASPMDVCNGMATLRTRFPQHTTAGQFVDEAYSGEIGLFGVRNNWDRTWSKGGGIPGFAPNTNVVFTNTAMVESNDGRAYAIVTMFNADEGFSMEALPFEVASLVSRVHELLVEGI